MASDPSESPECTYWDNSGCEGTPFCPPRCPRFVDEAGVSMLVRRPDGAGFDTLVQIYRELDSVHRTLGLPPRDSNRFRTLLRILTEESWNLVALDGHTVVGHVGVSPATASDPEFVIFLLDVLC
jgi:hypothetical protein